MSTFSYITWKSSPKLKCNALLLALLPEAATIARIISPCSLVYGTPVTDDLCVSDLVPDAPLKNVQAEPLSYHKVYYYLHQLNMQYDNYQFYHEVAV